LQEQGISALWAPVVFWSAGGGGSIPHERAAAHFFLGRPARRFRHQPGGPFVTDPDPPQWRRGGAYFFKGLPELNEPSAGTSGIVASLECASPKHKASAAPKASKDPLIMCGMQSAPVTATLLVQQGE
jgi:hypothetical protein